MQILSTVKRGIDKIMEWCCIIILAIMTVLVTYQVITRYCFNKPSAISETLAQYLFVWMIMFGSAYVFGLREHLDITVLKDRMNPPVRLAVEILTNLTLLVFAGGVMIHGGLKGALNQMGTVDAALQIPMGVIYIAVPFCGVITLFYAVYNCVLAVQEYKNHTARSSDGTAGTM
ncbi:TRAP transporter small permease [Oscillibacter ruminantium]|uniref:TRAP transporter small permease n=1 Tax=Oscillibacter ruminantium TaxID=1263547 RepID=UPI0033206DFF